MAELFFEELEDVLLVGAAAAALGLEVYAVADECEAEGVALAHEEFAEGGGGVAGEGELVGVADAALTFDGEEHGAAVVDDELAAEVGLLLEAFDEQLVGAGVELPVDVASGLAEGVLPMLGEFYGEAVKRTSVQAGDKSFDYLACKEVQ